MQRFFLQHIHQNKLKNYCVVQCLVQECRARSSHTIYIETDGRRALKNSQSKYVKFDLMFLRQCPLVHNVMQKMQSSTQRAL